MLLSQFIEKLAQRYPAHWQPDEADVALLEREVTPVWRQPEGGYYFMGLLAPLMLCLPALEMPPLMAYTAFAVTSLLGVWIPIGWAKEPWWKGLIDTLSLLARGFGWWYVFESPALPWWAALLGVLAQEALLLGGRPHGINLWAGVVSLGLGLGYALHQAAHPGSLHWLTGLVAALATGSITYEHLLLKRRLLYPQVRTLWTALGTVLAGLTIVVAGPTVEVPKAWLSSVMILPHLLMLIRAIMHRQGLKQASAPVVALSMTALLVFPIVYPLLIAAVWLLLAGIQLQHVPLRGLGLATLGTAVMHMLYQLESVNWTALGAILLLVGVGSLLTLVRLTRRGQHDA
jgi:hypothetical protein